MCACVSELLVDWVLRGLRGWMALRLGYPVNEGIGCIYKGPKAHLGLQLQRNQWFYKQLKRRFLDALGGICMEPKRHLHSCNEINGFEKPRGGPGGLQT